ncbi:InlB B-repeat-containing protein [Chrysiogenes arsenatis]|uniref:InlB B-repeat-containing protein n=1 Tax=Chrysiogenes arsenatis TaxID=309797 RepID=UPI0004081708|nr:InlB B-repeat-containing protein [Chrysiogenes arsenatis]
MCILGKFKKIFALSQSIAMVCLMGLSAYAWANDQRREVAFIDAGIADYQTLMEAIPPTTVVYLLDPSRDGVQQMADILAEQNALDAIHILSHGSAGEKQIGTARLNTHTLEYYHHDLKQIGQSLQPGGDILLYGCEVASGESGRKFIDLLSKLTKANIAASTNKTGASAKHGDWMLEAGSKNSLALQFDHYPHTLQIPSDGLYTFANANQNPDGTVSTADDFFIVDRLDGSGASKATQADEFGAYIEDETESTTTYTSYLEVRVALTGSFYLTNATIGEYNQDGTSPHNNFTSVYLAGYANGVRVCETTPISSIGAYETAYTIDYSPCFNTLMDSFRAYYTMSVGDRQDNFNLIDFTLSGASTNSVSDTTPPTFAIAPAASNITAISFDLSASLDEAGSIYYVALADGAAVPSSADVKAATAAGGGSALASGNAAATSDPYSHTFNVSGLLASTTYDVYVVAEDDENTPNLMASPILVKVTTTAPPAPTFVALDGDTMEWAGNTETVSLATSVTTSDTFRNALNGGSGDYEGVTLRVQRIQNGAPDPTIHDIFGIEHSGTSFALVGNAIQVNGTGQTFATFTNNGGVLAITFSTIGTIPTTARVQEVLRSITYRNDRPYGDATLRFAFEAGGDSSHADVTVLSSTIYVDREAFDDDGDAADGFNLAEALAIAQDGDTILLLDGTYRGQFLATTAVTINAALGDNGVVTLEAPDSSDLVYSPQDMLTNNGRHRYPILDLRTAVPGQGVVSVSNIVVDGRYHAIDDEHNANEDLIGIGIFDTRATLDSVEVRNIAALRNDTGELSGFSENFGIAVEGSDTLEERITVTIRNSTFSSIQKTALIAWGPKLHMVIEDNTFTGDGVYGRSGQNGMQIGSSGLRTGTTAEIRRNTLREYDFDHESYSGTGILLRMTDTVEVSDNTVTVTGRTAAANRGIGVDIMEVSAPVTVRGNTFENLALGVLIESPYGTLYHGEHTIEQNNFNSSYQAVSNPVAGPQNRLLITQSSAASVTNGLGFLEFILNDADDVFIDTGAAPSWVSGGSGSDTITTGSGSDTLEGGSGNDTLTGGAGSDVFLYDTTDNGIDLITDFGAGDRIRVNTQDFAGGTVTLGNGTNVAASSVQVAVDGNETRLYIDTIGTAGAPELEIRLTGVYGVEHFTLSGSDIVFTTPIYTVNFSAGGTVVESAEALYGDTIELPTPSAQENHEFIGWYKNSGLTQLFDPATDTITGNTTLYAKFVEIFIFDTAEGTILDYKGTATHVVIPTQIYGYDVVRIGAAGTNTCPLLFRCKELESVVIPEGVQIIGSNAFNDANLTAVTLPSTLETIENGAFALNTFAGFSVNIPENVKYIGDHAFYNSGLAGATLPTDLAFLGEHAFGLNQIAAITIPSGIGTIQRGVFWRNQLTHVTIPEGITSIAGSAFNDNQLESVTLPEGITSIGDYAFAQNELAALSIPATVQLIDEYAFYNNKIVDLTLNGDSLETIEVQAFRDNLIEAVTLPTSLVHVGAYAFGDNPNLTQVTIGSGVALEDYFTNPNWWFEHAYTNWYNKEDGTYVYRYVDSTSSWSWIPLTHALAFHTNGGSEQAGQNVKHNRTATEPSDPTRDGYSFAGWFTDIALNDTFEFNTLITTPATLYAKWNPNTYTLNFDANSADGVSGNLDAITVTFSEAVGSLPAPQRSGHSFAGWNTQPDGGGDTFTGATVYVDTNDSTLYAQWSVSQYTITFASNGGSAVSAITQNYGSAITAPVAPTREGYTFAGWNPAVPNTMPAGGATLTAQWTVNEYTITFDSAGGSAVASITQNFGTDVTAPAAPTRTGYTFAGWSPAVPTTMAVGGAALTAQWNINQYSVSFVDHDSAVLKSDSVEHGSGATAPANPTRVGYTFTGWSPASFTNITGDTSITALYSLNRYPITVLVDGQGIVSSPDSAEHGSTISVSATANAGYTFIEWQRGQAALSSLNPYQFTVTETIEITAIFRDITSPDSGEISTLPTLSNRDTGELRGRGEPGSTVYLYNNSNLIGSQEIDQNGDWSIVLGTEHLPEGENRFSIVITDLYGNRSDTSESVLWQIDRTAPDAPVINGLPAVTLEVLDLTLSGTAEPLSLVSLTRNGIAIGTTSVTANGIWEYTSSLPGYDTYEFVAYAEDMAGNRSVASSTLMVIAKAPVTPGISDAQCVQDTAHAITFDAIRGANTTANSVTSNLMLNSILVDCGAQVQWTSSLPAVISHFGVVSTLPSERNRNRTVTMTAVISKGAATTEKGLLLTVPQAGISSVDMLAADRSALTFIDIRGVNIVPREITGSLVFPTAGKLYASTITWSASPTGVVNTITGAVVRPIYPHSSQAVTLVARISRDGLDTVETFEITVLPLPQDDNAAVATDRATLFPELKLNRGLHQVATALGLPIAGASGTTITWHSDSPEYLSVAGNDAIPHPQAGATHTVRLTATLHKGTASTTRIFLITIPGTATASDEITGISANVDSIEFTADAHTVTFTGSNATSTIANHSNSKAVGLDGDAIKSVVVRSDNGEASAVQQATFYQNSNGTLESTIDVKRAGDTSESSQVQLRVAAGVTIKAEMTDSGEAVIAITTGATRSTVRVDTSGAAIHQVTLSGQETTEAISRLANTTVRVDSSGAVHTQATTLQNNGAVHVSVIGQSDGTATHELTVGNHMVRATSHIPGAKTEVKDSGEIETRVNLLPLFAGTPAVTVIANPDGSAEHRVTLGNAFSSANTTLPGAITDVRADTVETTVTTTIGGHTIKAIVETQANGESRTRFVRIDSSGNPAEIQPTADPTTPFELGNRAEIKENLNGDLIFTVNTNVTRELRF